MTYTWDNLVKNSWFPIITNVASSRQILLLQEYYHLIITQSIQVIMNLLMTKIVILDEKSNFGCMMQS